MNIIISMNGEPKFTFGNSITLASFINNLPSNIDQPGILEGMLREIREEIIGQLNIFLKVVGLNCSQNFYRIKSIWEYHLGFLQEWCRKIDKNYQNLNYFGLKNILTMILMILAYNPYNTEILQIVEQELTQLFEFHQKIENYDQKHKSILHRKKHLESNMAQLYKTSKDESEIIRISQELTTLENTLKELINEKENLRSYYLAHYIMIVGLSSAFYPSIKYIENNNQDQNYQDKK
jgi:hypothetical protein